MSSLKLTNGEIIKDQTAIMEAQVSYYEHLYSKKATFDNKKLINFVKNVNIPKLTDEQKKSCDGQITAEECKNAIKNMKTTSSPGFDGLTTSWYRVFWTKIEHILVPCLNEALNLGHMSNTQRTGILTLLHKGKSLPRDEMGNWRPISLTNTDYKILAKSLANRLKKVIGHIICEDQNGYIKGRHSGIVIRAIDDIIEYTNFNNMTGAMLALDYTKAFDSLSKEFMYKSLEKFGFGPIFIKWIHILNTNTVSCVNYCGWLSRWFPLDCGIRQGCPISPLCFILACEILSCHIRQNKQIKGIRLPLEIGGRNEMKIMQFADDSTLFLADECSIYQSLKAIDLFSEFTGLNLNKNKTEAIWLGCWKFRKKEIANMKWRIFPQNEIRILGVTFKNDCQACMVKCNWENKISTCEIIIKRWIGRNLSIIGRITLVKTFLLSQFMYLMQGIILPKHAMNRINKILFKYIWCNQNIYKESDINNVIEKVGRKTLIKSYEEGGLGMIDIIHMQNSIATKWITKLQQTGNGLWRSIPLFYLNKLGPKLIIFKMNANFKQLKGWNTQFPQFYTNLIEFWCEIPNKNSAHNFVNSSQILWNNQLCTYKGQVIFNHNWIKRGILFVSDVLVNNKLCNYEDLTDRIENNPIRRFEYNVIRNAIPVTGNSSHSSRGPAAIGRIRACYDTIYRLL